MDTAAAAAQAGVTTRTIRRWCVSGRVAATKLCRRWAIEADSLAAHIARRAHMDNADIYTVESVVIEGRDPRWVIVRSDGQADSRLTVFDSDHRDEDTARFCAEFLNRTPAEYRIRAGRYKARAGQMSSRSGAYWQIWGGRDDDPAPLDAVQPARDEYSGEACTVDRLVGMVTRHAAGADQRIADKQERAAKAAAEDAAREAAEAKRADAARRKGPLATGRQVEYILRLLESRRRTGEGGGFYSGPTTREEVELLSKSEASTYIDSLTGEY